MTEGEAFWEIDANWFDDRFSSSRCAKLYKSSGKETKLFPAKSNDLRFSSVYKFLKYWGYMLL